MTKNSLSVINISIKKYYSLKLSKNMNLKFNLATARTLSFATFGFILAGLIDVIQNTDNYKLVIVTGVIVATSLIMLLLNAVSSSKILGNQKLSEFVPVKLIGASLSLTALLLTVSVAAFLLAMKVQPSENVYIAMYTLMGALSLSQSITNSNIGLRLN